MRGAQPQDGSIHLPDIFSIILRVLSYSPSVSQHFAKPLENNSALTAEDPIFTATALKSFCLYFRDFASDSTILTKDDGRWDVASINLPRRMAGDRNYRKITTILAMGRPLRFAIPPPNDRGTKNQYFSSSISTTESPPHHNLALLLILITTTERAS